jgi:type 1 glutamine amidotransferase
MKTALSLAIGLSLVSVSFGALTAEQPSVLVFSKTAGFRHTAIEPGIEALKTLGNDNGFKVDTTEDSGQFTNANLRGYAAIVFLSTTGNVLNREQETAFESYIRAGGGFVGIHSATDTEYEWPWYGQLVGGWFNGHGEIQTAAIQPVAKFGDAKLPNPWVRRDEWYNFKHLSPHTHIILTLDTHSFAGSTHGSNHPIAWYHEFDGGHAFYTGLGHTDESFSEPAFLNHLLDGIRYAIGGRK